MITQICLKCQGKTHIYGEMNLGISTPKLIGSLPLCPRCWEQCLGSVSGLAEWENLALKIANLTLASTVAS